MSVEWSRRGGLDRDAEFEAGRHGDRERDIGGQEAQHLQVLVRRCGLCRARMEGRGRAGCREPRAMNESIGYVPATARADACMRESTCEADTEITERPLRRLV